MAQLKGKRHTPEQIVRKLGEADRLQAEGADVDAVTTQSGPTEHSASSHPQAATTATSPAAYTIERHDLLGGLIHEYRAAE